jgi:serine/threonine-protein kinase
MAEMIGRYEIQAELGRGGMATVYRAHDPRFKRDVALKVLPREFLHDPTFRARFEREAQTIAALEHPAIVPVYDFGEDNGQPYIVMRLMPGGSLADRMQAGPLPLAEIARIFTRLAPALDEAHAHGIVHRDLKPGNILFDQRGDPYLSDFGIAKLTEASAAFTGSAVIGTPAYMSPEQAKGERHIDGRSDVYSLGAILFQLLTGQTPYDADTPMGIVVKHIVDPVPNICAVKPDLPPACEPLIQQAMAKDRADRFGTAQALSSALDTVARGGDLPKPAAPPAPPPTIVSAPPVVAPPPPPAKPPAGPPPIPAPPLNPFPPAQRRKFPFKPVGIGCGVLFCVGLACLLLFAIASSNKKNTPASLPTHTPFPLLAETTPTPDLTTPIAAAPTLKPSATSPMVPTQVPHTPTFTPTTAPSPTSLPPTAITLPLSAYISSVSLDNNAYAIEYSVAGFAQALPGQHVHFFFNTVSPDQAGLPGLGPWKLYAGPSPYRYPASERPANATQLCILVANVDHSVIQGTGNCVDLP